MLLFAALAVAGALSVRDWLDAGDAPQPADVIVVLGGGFSRPLYAGDLYRERMAARILLSVERQSEEDLLLERIGLHLPNGIDITRAILAKRGVPDSALRFFDAEAMSTLDEAEIARRMLDDSTQRLLIVTSAFHTRRVKMIFGDVFPAARFRVVASPYEQFADPWWSEQESARNVLLEIAKIMFYRLGGGFRMTKPQGAADILPPQNPPRV